jgi:hypothetical protein
MPVISDFVPENDSFSKPNKKLLKTRGLWVVGRKKSGTFDMN